MKILFDFELLEEEQADLLNMIASQSHAKVHHFMVFETEDPLLVAAVETISQEWLGKVNELEPTLATPSIQAPVKVRKTGSRSRPNGICPKCGREAQLVKSNGLCKPCHMHALKKDKNREFIPGRQSEYGMKMEAARLENRDRVDAGIERVVEQARAEGTLGKPALKISKDEPKMFSGRKL
jgi:hypothetical protein